MSDRENSQSKMSFLIQATGHFPRPSPLNDALRMESGLF